ncbi:sensor histidine kinase [Halocola ammonii]
MNQKYIRILIVLITLAFIGLIAIQVYWINNSILLRENEFRYKVNVALEKVEQRLERNFYYENGASKKQRLRMMLRNSAPGKSLRYEFEGELPADSREYEITLDSDEVLDSLQSTANGKEDLKRVQDSLLYEQWGEYGLRQSDILEQSGLLEDVLSGDASLDILPSIEDRIDYNHVDSLLREELRDKGVSAKFKFGVFDADNTPEMVPESAHNFAPQLAESPFRVQLFPWEFETTPYFLKVHFPHQKRYLLQTMWLMLAISALLILAIMFAFSYTITTIFRQKKISEIKNDFINNMTHELKTPISTISLACEALSDPVMRSSEKRMKNFIRMISDENKRLGVLVENVLRSAILDRGEMDLNVERINLHELAQNVIKNIAIQVNKKGGSIKSDLAAVNPVIMGDRIHLTNVIYNMLDNAIKYSPESPVVQVTTADYQKGVLISFTDRGIGISKENQKKIFDKLYRVPTGDIHDVKGFGLGLSYVKVIVEKHHGEIWVESELNKGSTFNIYLPANHEE